ncbi:hypothetical protein [Flexithrix dorotheae]|uniref:hypothetical protein n=1 Tax=Flexithrix dorotheae TaxID=70993 RepID=UPI0003AA8030|nr:hypothetical protein [Flexithrix dorotheae]
MILPVIFGIEKKAQEKQTLFKLLGSFLMASGGFLAINYFGFGAGLIYLSIVLMTIASLIILLIPLGVLNKTTFLITSIISVLIENLI